MASSSTNIIHHAANSALTPLGLTQKGSSRTWLDDQSWWVALIEFQPDRGAEGTYLNVGACWLWVPQDHFSFDLGYRESKFVAYETDAQFLKDLDALAERAAGHVRSLRRKLATFESAYDFVLKYPFTDPRDSWVVLHRAVLAGLTGSMHACQEGFAEVLRGRIEKPWEIDRARLIETMLGSLSDPKKFKEQVYRNVAEARQRLKLAPPSMFPSA